MIRFSWRRYLALGAACLLFAGCGGNGSGPPTTGTQGGGAVGGSGTAAPAGPRTYQLSDLSVALGDYLPPLDGGRVEMARPADWRVGSRQSGLVVWFHRHNDSRLLPQIRVTAENAPADAPQSAHVADAQDYADWVAAEVQEQLGETEKLIEPVRAVVLGDHAFGRYVRAGRRGGSLVERQILTTTHNGRIYHIELIVLPDKLLEAQTRDAGYAVAAGMKFLESAAPPAIQAGDEAHEGLAP